MQTLNPLTLNPDSPPPRTSRRRPRRCWKETGAQPPPPPRQQVAFLSNISLQLHRAREHPHLRDRRRRLVSPSRQHIFHQTRTNYNVQLYLLYLLYLLHLLFLYVSPHLRHRRRHLVRLHRVRVLPLSQLLVARELREAELNNNLFFRH